MKILEQYKARNAEKRAYYQNLMKRCLSEPVTQEQQKQASKYYQLYQNTSSLSSSFFQLYNHKHSNHNAKIALDSVCFDQLYKALDRIFGIGIDFMTSKLRGQLAQCREFFSQRALLKHRYENELHYFNFHVQLAQKYATLYLISSLFIVAFIIVFSIAMIICLERILTINYADCHIHGMFIAPAYYSLSNIQQASLKFPSFMSPVVRFILTQFFSEQSINYVANQMARQWFPFLVSLGISSILMVLLIKYRRKSFIQKVKYQRVQVMLKQKADEAKAKGKFLKKLDWIVNNDF